MHNTPFFHHVLGEEHTALSVDLLCECFRHDKYYKKLTGFLFRKRKMKKMFATAINVCLKYGTLYGMWDSSDLVGISLIFDYNFLKKEQPLEFWKVFTDPKGSVDENIIDLFNSLINPDSNTLYLLNIAVKSEYRRLGFAGTMINAIKNLYPKHNIITDASNNILSDFLQRRHDFKKVGQYSGLDFILYKIK